MTIKIGINGMVEQCSPNLNLALLPDEVTAIVAALEAGLPPL